LKILFEPLLPGAAARRPSLALLVTIAMLGTMALHMFIPALPATAADLNASPGMIQLTVTLYLVGLAAGQLIYGPLSDRFGRRPLLLGGLCLYVISTLLAAFADSAGELIVERVFQSLGACSGLVLGRAMVRDGTSTLEAARTLAVLMTAMVIAPALAPGVGGYVTAWVGWRGTFAVLTCVGTVVLLLSVLILPETHHQRTPLPGIMPMLRSYRRLLGMRVFRGYALGGCCTSTSLYAYFSSSPFLFMDVLHRSVEDVGLYSLYVACGIGTGTFLASRLVRRFGARDLARTGNHVQLIGALLLLLVDRSGMLSVATVVGTMMLLSVGSGLATPNAAASAVGADPQAIGAAAGLYGAMQMAFGALCSLIVGSWHSASALPMATVLLVSAVAGQFAFAYGAKALSATR